MLKFRGAQTHTSFAILQLRCYPCPSCWTFELDGEWKQREIEEYISSHGDDADNSRTTISIFILDTITITPLNIGPSMVGRTKERTIIASRWIGGISACPPWHARYTSITHQPHADNPVTTVQQSQLLCNCWLNTLWSTRTHNHHHRHPRIHCCLQFDGQC